MADTILCRQCNTPVQRQSIDALSGEEGVVRIKVTGLPVLVCERGHRRFISADFPLKLLEQVAGVKIDLPVARKQGLLFKKLHCSQCDVLLGADKASRTFQSSATVGDATLAFELEVQVEVCTACKHEQLREEGLVEGSLSAALAHAFQGAEIRPPG